MGFWRATGCRAVRAVCAAAHHRRSVARYADQSSMSSRRRSNRSERAQAASTLFWTRASQRGLDDFARVVGPLSRKLHVKPPRLRKKEAAPWADEPG